MSIARWCFALLLGLMAAAAPARAEAPTFLKTLIDSEGGVTIAYGETDESRQAAELVHQAILKLPGAADGQNVRLVKAEEFDALDFPEAGATHVIAVGTLRDNAVLRGRNWLPTWWLDRDWYYSEYKFAVKPEDALKYQPTTGFIAGGFGEWPAGTAGVGIVEVDRSEYFMEWMVRSRYETAAGGKIINGNHHSFRKLTRVTSPTYPNDFPLRLMVRITGSGGAGVIESARAFAERGMLGGVVLAGDTQADPGPTMFTLPTERYVVDLPFTPPAGEHGYSYMGWLLASAFEYDGFRHDAGVAARVMYRIKYKPDFGITNFWTTPHRRASQFEVCVVMFDSEEDAKKAETNLRTTLADTPGGKENRITGFSTAVVGKALVLESLPEPAGAAILEKFKQLDLK